MATWIGLLRGINVGGKNRLRMSELKALLKTFGLKNIETYIQSGNVVFQAPEPISPALSADIATAIETQHGFRPEVFLLSAAQLEGAIKANPFPEAEDEPKTLHLFFLASAPAAPDTEALARAKAASERFQLTDQVFYLHAPDGIGRSKLAAKVERCLGVAVTARNWRTVEKLRGMAWAL